tara:strand:+ start:564 stop:2117 length:1554 start_codon:yes stop_codon:yes gene_type:complete
MRSIRFTLVTATIVLMTALGPPLVSLYLARQQGLQIEMERVRDYAEVVVQRSDRAVEQMQEAIDMLIAEGAADPCSADMLQLMRQLALRGEFMKAAGVVDGNFMPCSSLGLHEPPMNLGQPDSITATGTALRLSSPMPLPDDTPYISIARDGFVAMAHRNQAVDIATDIQGAVFATFNPLDGEIRTSVGEANPDWIERLGDESEATFVDGGYVVAVLLSDQVGQTGSLAAEPLFHLDERVREISLRWLPFSLLAAGVLTLAFLYAARQQVSMATQIRLGLRRDEFFLEYQPIVDLQTSEWVGAEALLRWRTRDGKLVEPDIFIPVAEESDLINLITNRVLELAAQDMGGFLRDNPGMSLSINLSASDILLPATSEHLLSVIKRFNLRPGQLTVELTERMLVEPEKARVALAAMREQGIRVSIDDFGTGYSSLSYLETMPFDSLKIDRLFVEAIDKEAATSRVVLHLIEMANTLQLDVVAEGVETEKQAAYLRERGVRYAQGWLYSKSLPADIFKATC